MITKVTSGDLVAVRVRQGPQWPKILRAIWNAGAAVLPVDPRLPEVAVAGVLEAMRPTMLLDDTGLTRLDGVGTECALVMLTSGTTGEPRGVEVTHQMLEAALRGSEALLGARPDDRWLCCMPVAHMGGMLSMLRGMRDGAWPVVLSWFDAVAVCSSEATHTSVVPSVVSRIGCLDRFRGVLVGGAASAPLPPPCVRTYGMTQTCGGIAYEGELMPGIEARIEIDEVLVRGPQVARRYRLGDEIGEWIATGDAGRLVDGKLEVLGRLDDRINTGGEKVWPAQVEAVLRTHPGVIDCAVFGEADLQWGERVVALIVGDADLETIRKHVSQTLPTYAAPREVRVVTEIPRNAGGKLVPNHGSSRPAG